MNAQNLAGKFNQKPMTPENYEKLRQKIIAACPDISDALPSIFYQEEEPVLIDEPIGISHVLRAIEEGTHRSLRDDFSKKAREYSLIDEGFEDHYSLSDFILQLWILEYDDLALQSDDVKEFLFDLLCNDDA